MRIRDRLTLVISLAVLAITILFSFVQAVIQFQNEGSRFQKRIENDNGLARQLMLGPLWNLDNDDVNNNAQALLADPEIDGVTVADSHGDKFFVERHNYGGPYVTVDISVMVQDLNVGFVKLVYSKRLIMENVRQMILINTTLALVLMIGVNLVVFLATFSITRPLVRVVESIEALSLHDFQLQIPIQAQGEVGVLIDAINTMGQELKNREQTIRLVTTDAVASKTKFEILTQAHQQSEILRQQLQESLDHLRLTQQQLIVSEKMALLGSLVAGISHEINTPLGICVTTASFLEDQAQEFGRQLEEGSIKRSLLDEFTATIREATQILMMNLNRASDLIGSFKQVSVDQTSDAQRTFFLKTYLGEILQSLHPNLKKSHCRVEVLGPDDLAITSYPGAFSQLFTNLIMNSLIHGFSNQEGELIRITIGTEENWLCILYEDNGKGLTAEGVAHVFEPFYTTKRESGGTGLGAYIVYNLVTQRLGGTITVHSEPEKGVQFAMRIPRAEN